MKITPHLRLLIILGLTGCRAAVPDGPPTADVAVVRNRVSEIADATGSAVLFRAYFAADAQVPPETERPKYRRLYFKAAGDPSISGSTATIKVSVRDDNSTDPIGQVVWTFVKEGEQWKAKSAPLP